MRLALIVFLIFAGPVLGQEELLPAPTAVVTPAWAMQLAYADCGRLPEPIREKVCYLWLRGSAAERLTHWQMASVWAHLQSRRAEKYPPLVVCADGEVVHPFSVTLLPAPGKRDWSQVELVRFNRDDYRWSVKVWNEFGFQDPYFHRVVSKPTTAVKTDRDGRTGQPIWFDARQSKWVLFSEAKPPASDALELAPWLSETPQARDATVGLATMTQTDTPILRADNWVWQVAIAEDRRVGYYGLLEIKNQADYDRAIGFDPKANIDPSFLEPVLAAVNKQDSGVAERSRRIEINQKPGGRRYITKDNKDTDEKVVVGGIDTFPRNPLRTLNGGLKSKATEAFGHNAAGFWIMGLFNNEDNGSRQNTAPDFVGGAEMPHNNDKRIHVGYSCLTCHDNGGLQDIRCWFRKAQAPPNPLALQAVVQKFADFQRVDALRHYQEPLDPLIQEDRERYGKALYAVSGLKPQEFAAKLRRYYAEYDGGVNLERAAGDLGVTAREFWQAIYRYSMARGETDPIVGMWIKDPKAKISIEDWHQTYPQMQLVLRGLVEWPSKSR